MSYVTDIVLTAHCAEGDTTPFEKFLMVTRVDESFVGARAMQSNVYVGSFSYMNMARFVWAVRSQDWKYPDSVALFARGENDDRFAEVPLNMNERPEAA
jgi:hypothetical protein